LTRLLALLLTVRVKVLFQDRVVVSVRTWLLFAFVVACALVTVSAVADRLPGAVTSSLFGVIVVGAGLGANLLATSRRRRRRADSPGSVERECADAAAASTLPVSLVLLVAMGSWLAITQSLTAASVAYGAAMILVATFWVSYARARREF